jgi:hypothetical protein
MKVHFLEASTPLTKQFSSDAKGNLTKTPYPFVWEFTSHDEDIKTLADLEVTLKKHAALGRCMLKGSLQRPLVKESRAGSTQTGSDTQLLVLDLDGLPISATGPKGLTSFLEDLGLDDISYIVQWSASYGITNNDLRCHIFMLLDRPYAAPLLKQWLIQKNHEVPLLTNSMHLTKTGNAISWPLDVSACQNDKLIYIAPPKLSGIKDPLPRTKRIALVKKKKDTLSLSDQINSTDRNRVLTTKRIEILRDAAGLPKRKITYKMHGTTEVMVKPDSCTVTESKVERGFVYFNLNGGDSWAYYHPENNPDYIYSFKGESAYLTKELLPDYWAELCSAPKLTSSGDLYLAFCDRKTGGYWRGTYNQNTDELELYPAKNETQVRHFAKQYGMPIGEFIPEWDLTFDPHDNVRVDPVNRTVNYFAPTEFMLAAQAKITKIPPTISKVVTHALGGEKETVEHFLNWLAYILQTRDKAKTAWILHGVPGTGKGILTHNILRPIFGPAQTATRRMEELNEPYNHWMKTALLCFIDEVQTKALQNERGVMAKLKNFITEMNVVIREMYHGGHECRSYSNFIFMSNMPDPVSIDKHDRRFNVGKYQPDKLVITDKELASLDKELQAFHDYLASYKVDVKAAMTPLETEDRTTMINISESSVDTVGNALLTGNFGFFVDQLPTGTEYKAKADAFNKVENYRSALKNIMARTDRNTGACTIHRDELLVLFEFAVGGMPTTPNKFTSLLKHHRLHITKVWLDGKTVNGIKAMFQDVDQWTEYGREVNPNAAPVAKPKKLKAVA